MTDNNRTDKERITALETDVKNLKEDAKEFVTSDQFSPVKLIAYGLAAIALASVVTSIVSKVVH